MADYTATLGERIDAHYIAENGGDQKTETIEAITDAPYIPESALVQFRGSTFTTGDGVWSDDTSNGYNASFTGDLQEDTLSDGAAAVRSDGTDDGATHPMPSELDGNGFDKSTTEFAIQTTQTDQAWAWGITTSGSNWYCSINVDQGFNSDSGNFLVFCEDSNGRAFAAAPSTNPGINDGNRHDITVILNDSSNENVEIIIDGSNVSVSIDSRGTSGPSGFDWGAEMGLFASNSGSLGNYSNIALGIWRMHDTNIDNQTISGYPL